MEPTDTQLVGSPPQKGQGKFEPTRGACSGFKDIPAPPQVMPVVWPSPEPAASKVGVEGSLPDEAITAPGPLRFKGFNPFSGHDVLDLFSGVVTDSVCPLEVLTLASGEEGVVHHQAVLNHCPEVAAVQSV